MLAGISTESCRNDARLLELTGLPRAHCLPNALRGEEVTRGNTGQARKGLWRAPGSDTAGMKLSPLFKGEGGEERERERKREGGRGC